MWNDNYDIANLEVTKLEARALLPKKGRTFEQPSTLAAITWSKKHRKIPTEDGPACLKLWKQPRWFFCCNNKQTWLERSSKKSPCKLCAVRKFVVFFSWTLVALRAAFLGLEKYVGLKVVQEKLIFTFCLGSIKNQFKHYFRVVPEKKNKVALSWWPYLGSCKAWFL